MKSAMVGLPRGSDIVLKTPGGLLSARYTRSWRAGIRLPSTRMIWRAVSTGAPNLATTSPWTSTLPSPIWGSQCLRLPMPAAASTFCNRTPAVALSASAPGLYTFDFLNVVRQQGGEFGKLVQRPQAGALEEIARRAVQDGPGLLFGARLFDQAAQHQRPHHAVAVDSAHRGHARTAHRLPVGDHRERFQRRLGEPHLLPVAHEALDHGRAFRPGVEPPPPGDLAQVES